MNNNNGFTNYPTYICSIELSSDYGTYQLANSELSKSGDLTDNDLLLLVTEALGNILSDQYRKLSCTTYQDTKSLDINWREIASVYINSYMEG